MKLAPSGIGAEPKKLAVLGGIVVVGVVVVWLQNRSDSPVSADVAPAAAAVPQPIKPLPAKTSQVTEEQAESAARGQSQDKSSIARPSALGGGGNDTFIPSMKKKDDLDVSKVDPRIRLDLLAKVRAVPMEGGSSSLFDFSKPPEPPAPKVPPIVPGPVPPPAVKPVETAKGATTITTPAPPPAPPPPFKYYGYAGNTDDGHLQGLFLEGDPINGVIYPESEGGVIKNRYKIVRIGLKSAVVEDTTNHSQHTLKLLDEQQP